MTFEHGARRVSRRVDVVRNGVVVTTMRIVSAPTVAMRADAELKMNLSGTFEVNTEMQPESDVLRPVMIINGTEYPLGEYAISVLEIQYEENAAHVQIEAYDRSLYLKQSKIEQRYYIQAGSKYTDVAQAILMEAGINRAICIPSTATFATDRDDWEIGTSRLRILNDILAEINYESIWFDMNGNARIHPYEVPSAANIAHRYESGEYSIIKDNYTSEIDIFDTPNIFVAIVSNPDYDVPMIATAVNDTPTSIMSTVQRGRRIVRVDKINNIASQEELQAYVDNERTKSMLAAETTRFYTAIEPTHGMRDVIALNNGSASGIYQETEWQITMEAGADMVHTARRAMYL